MHAKASMYTRTLDTNKYSQIWGSDIDQMDNYELSKYELFISQ